MPSRRAPLAAFSAPVLPEPSEQAGKRQRVQIARKQGMFIHFGTGALHNQQWTDWGKTGVPS